MDIILKTLRLKNQLISILAIIFLLGSTSCSNSRSFNIKFINDSKYDIEKLVFSMSGIKRDTISVQSNNSSKVYHLKYQKSWKENFSEPFMLFYILSYSGSPKNTHKSTGGISRTDLEKNELNNIVISYDSIENRFYFRLMN